MKAQDEAGKAIVRRDQRLGTFLEDWLENEIRRRRRAKTYASYAQLVRGHMLRRLGSVKLRELTARKPDRLVRVAADRRRGPAEQPSRGSSAPSHQAPSAVAW